MQPDTERYCRLAIELQDSQRRQPLAGDDRIERLRPIRARLEGRDFWQLQDHRRRCEAGGPAPCPPLAAYLRAKLLDAEIVPAGAARAAGFVTGDSSVLCRIEGGPARQLRLYHWIPPEPGYGACTGHWLGAMLIGMRAGQRAGLPGIPDAPALLEVLHVEPG